jgi:hypothetical protein
MPNPTARQLDAGLAAHFALKDGTEKPVSMAKDPEAHVAVIAQAVLDNEAWDRGTIVAVLREYAHGLERTGEDAACAQVREQADLMEGRES